MASALWYSLRTGIHYLLLYWSYLEHKTHLFEIFVIIHVSLSSWHYSFNLPWTEEAIKQHLHGEEPQSFAMKDASLWHKS